MIYNLMYSWLKANKIKVQIARNNLPSASKIQKPTATRNLLNLLMPSTSMNNSEKLQGKVSSLGKWKNKQKKKNLEPPLEEKQKPLSIILTLINLCLRIVHQESYSCVQFLKITPTNASTISSVILEQS